MNDKAPIRVAVTGAAGQIGYSLLFRIASGGLFGPDQPVALNLIEIEPGMKALEGVVMELEDGAFPLLKDIRPTCDINEGFSGANWSLLVGSVPRKAGMERGDLLGINGKIFTGQGQAIQNNAAADARILVVGNPCNTNCLIAMNNAPDIPRDRWFAMTRLDENRAAAQLAFKAGVAGFRGLQRHDLGQSFGHPISGLLQCEDRRAVRPGRHFRRHMGSRDFIPTVQQRGAAIIQARGASSAASAANAAIDTVRSLVNPTPEGDWNSVCVASDGSYGTKEGLITSFPVRSDGQNWEIVKDLPINDFAREKIDASVSELNEEREMVSDLLPS